MREPRYVPTREGVDVERARGALMGVLRRTRLPVDRCGDKAVNHPKYGAHRTHLLSFGISQSHKNRCARALQGKHTRKTADESNHKYAGPYAVLCFVEC